MATASAPAAREVAAEMSTPLNRVTRENLTVLIRNNVLNESVEFGSDCDTSMMETDSPLGKPSLQLISKKLFHSPMPEETLRASCTRSALEKTRKSRKRKQSLLPDSEEKIKRAYVAECERDGRSPRPRTEMRQRVLISLFHNKEYSMDFS